MTEGGKAAGLSEDVGNIAGWGVVLANLPGTLSHFKYILMDEKENPFRQDLEDELNKLGGNLPQILVLLKAMETRWKGLTCSMFGVWGSRTVNNKLFTGRNLDWLKDTGISDGHAHATIGWAGIWGAITGISAAGITVHEANLESDDITFRGFPWVLRLRHVMANAKTISEAVAIWQSTNNTVGFNHGIGSAADKQAIVIETMEGNSAIFGANDPREQNLVVNGVQIGQPRTEAVYRTNHGYDPYTEPIP